MIATDDQTLKVQDMATSAELTSLAGPTDEV
jgi:hypothetical protein